MIAAIITLGFIASIFFILIVIMNSTINNQNKTISAKDKELEAVQKTCNTQKAYLDKAHESIAAWRVKYLESKPKFFIEVEELPSGRFRWCLNRPVRLGESSDMILKSGYTDKESKAYKKAIEAYRSYQEVETTAAELKERNANRLKIELR